MKSTTRPTILVIAGHDPTGGAGIAADIETINALGGHACSLVTALTVQDSSNLQSFEPVESGLISRQFQAIQRDFQIDAVKIGMLGSAETARQVAGFVQTLSRQVDAPIVILDPVLSAGGGADLANDNLLEAIKTHLLPQVDLLTPNLPEARRLTDDLTDKSADQGSAQQSIDDCARQLLQAGCKNILITGTHDTTENVVNHLFGASGRLDLPAPRLDGVFHGSGCTLASAVACYLASGHSLTNAVKQAISFTLDSLRHADQPGSGQAFPLRNPASWS